MKPHERHHSSTGTGRDDRCSGFVVTSGTANIAETTVDEGLTRHSPGVWTRTETHIGLGALCGRDLDHITGHGPDVRFHSANHPWDVAAILGKLTYRLGRHGPGWWILNTAAGGPHAWIVDGRSPRTRDAVADTLRNETARRQHDGSRHGPVTFAVAVDDGPVRWIPGGIIAAADPDDWADVACSWTAPWWWKAVTDALRPNRPGHHAAGTGLFRHLVTYMQPQETACRLQPVTSILIDGVVIDRNPHEASDALWAADHKTFIDPARDADDRYCALRTAHRADVAGWLIDSGALDANDLSPNERLTSSYRVVADDSGLGIAHGTDRTGPVPVITPEPVGDDREAIDRYNVVLNNRSHDTYGVDTDTTLWWYPTGDAETVDEYRHRHRTDTNPGRRQLTRWILDRVGLADTTTHIETDGGQRRIRLLAPTTRIEISGSLAETVVLAGGWHPYRNIGPHEATVLGTTAGSEMADQIIGIDAVHVHPALIDLSYDTWASDGPQEETWSLYDQLRRSGTRATEAIETIRALAGLDT